MKDHGLATSLGDDYADRELAEEGEPVFVLRGQDILAADVVEHWADLAAIAGVNRDKIEGARQIAAEMRAYPGRRKPN
jgi:hypothetical protein